MPELRDRLGQTYRIAWDAMLAGIPGTPRQTVKELTAFWPMVGRRHPRELMVVGQASEWLDSYRVGGASPNGRCETATDRGCARRICR